MEVVVSETKEDCGKKAAAHGAELLRQAIAENGKAAIVVATGASQFEMLAALVKAESIDWTRVTGFHLDEYIGMPMTHPASFRKYLKERFVDHLPSPLAATRRRVVPGAPGRADPGHLDVDPPDREVTCHHLHRARRAQGQGRQGRRRRARDAGVPVVDPSATRGGHAVSR